MKQPKELSLSEYLSIKKLLYQVQSAIMKANGLTWDKLKEMDGAFAQQLVEGKDLGDGVEVVVEDRPKFLHRVREGEKPYLMDPKVIIRHMEDEDGKK